MIAHRICLALGLASATAAAGPLRVDAERCASLDAGALGVAVDRELALAPARDRAIDGVAVEIACPDGIHARVRITPGAVARDLDLGEEPVALRVKFVALAVAELVGTLAASPPSSPAPPSPIDDGENPPVPVAPTVVTRDLTMRAGLRVMGWDHVLSTLLVDLDVGPVRVGLTAALGHESLGMPYLVEASVSRALACSRGATSVCLVARAGAGFYGMSIHKADGDVMDQTLLGGYYDASIGIEAKRRIAGWNWIAGLDIGAGDGMLVEADYLEQFDGPFAAATLGASW